MKIGSLAKATGTKVETVRYYEGIGLMPEPERTSANYRSYTDVHRDRLNFIRHARGLGFDISDVRSLLDLADQPERDCGEVDRIASGHLQAIDEKIARLEVLREELGRVIGQCRGGQVGECRIMEVLSKHGHCQAEHHSST